MNKIITFFGADSGVGTTMSAQATAEALAEGKNKVLLIMASSNPFMDYYRTGDIIDRSIDELRPALRSGNLKKEEILNICYRHKNLTILPPIKDLTLIRYFQETDIKTISKLVDDEFDYIVIDGGCSIQHPLNISSLISCHKLFIVLTQQEKSINRYKLLKETVLLPLKLEHSIIVNKFFESSPYYSKKNFNHITGNDNVFTINNCENSWEAELRKETLLRYPKYREGISSMVMDIEVEREYKFSFKGRSKKGIFGGGNVGIN